MKYEILVSSYFKAEVKRLAKRYESFADDLESLEKSLLKNPLQGTELSPGIRKIRMSIKSKSKGRSGGARVITFTYSNTEEIGKIVLLLLYDKSDSSGVNVSIVKKIVKELEL